VDAVEYAGAEDCVGELEFVYDAAGGDEEGVAGDAGEDDGAAGEEGDAVDVVDDVLTDGEEAEAPPLRG